MYIHIYICVCFILYSYTEISFNDFWYAILSTIWPQPMNIMGQFSILVKCLGSEAWLSGFWNPPLPISNYDRQNSNMALRVPAPGAHTPFSSYSAKQ